MKMPERYILIHCRGFLLELIDHGQVVFSATASYAKNGFGEMAGSEKTPLGWHEVAAKIGEGKPLNAVFVGREFTGEVFSEALAAEHPTRDWILTRILWLSGLESHNANTKERYIYIHGAPDHKAGTAHTHGCISLKNRDMMQLYDLVDVHTAVLIQE
jgi:hypothetical protein